MFWLKEQVSLGTMEVIRFDYVLKGEKSDLFVVIAGLLVRHWIDYLRHHPYLFVCDCVKEDLSCPTQFYLEHTNRLFI